MKAIGYIVEEYGMEAALTEEFRTRIAAFATGLGAGVVRFYQDAADALMLPFVRRAGAEQLLKELADGDIVVVVKAVWVLTSAADALELIRLLAARKISLYCLDLEENLTLPAPRQLKVYEGSAPLVEKLLTVLAQNEQTGHAKAIRAAKKRMKSEGKYLGGPVPFGWRVSGAVLVTDREQQKIIREIRKLKDDRWSFREIAEKLREKHGLNFSHEGIRKIYLKSNEKNAPSSEK